MSKRKSIHYQYTKENKGKYKRQRGGNPRGCTHTHTHTQLN